LLPSFPYTTLFRSPASEIASEQKQVQLAPGVEEALKNIEAKSTKLGFQTKIRIVAVDKSFEAAKQRLDLVVGSFKQYNTTNLNGFVATAINGSGDQVVAEYASRMFGGKGMVLNVTELASIYHLPSNKIGRAT